MSDNSDTGSPDDGSHSVQTSALDEAWHRQFEAELVEGCLARDPPYFDRLVTTYIGWVRAAATKASLEGHTRVSCQRIDMVQGFFAHLWSEPWILERFDSHDGALGPWLNLVAYRWFLKYLRSPDVSWPDPVTSKRDMERCPCPETPLPPLEAAQIVARILAHFSSTTGDIVQARYGVGQYARGQTVEEIAQRLGMTKSQVYHRLAKIRRRRVRQRFSLDELEEI